MGDPLARTPLFQAATANFNPHAQTKVDTQNEDRGPLLLTMGGKDHTVPEAISKSTYKQYRHSGATTELAEFADRGHSLTVDHGWREIADSVLSWLKGKGV
jgi:predicted esterase